MRNSGVRSPSALQARPARRHFRVAPSPRHYGKWSLRRPAADAAHGDGQKGRTQRHSMILLGSGGALGFSLSASGSAGRTGRQWLCGLHGDGRWRPENLRWKNATHFVWTDGLQALFVFQRLAAVLYCYFYKRTALHLGDPRFYQDSLWLRKEFAQVRS
ncbi:transmembrane protein 138 isoform X4 [Chelonia mydas]|uniref:transmembrane protein 138 isoform X4 n=1 Tax=Chelonia mydas TaxID=8469 RepID=UPI001CA8EF7B|nr:transmembrane protein 138 isoform X4 [Chelonia mydas]